MLYHKLYARLTEFLFSPRVETSKHTPKNAFLDKEAAPKSVNFLKVASTPAGLGNRESLYRKGGVAASDKPFFSRFLPFFQPRFFEGGARLASLGAAKLA